VEINSFKKLNPFKRFPVLCVVCGHLVLALRRVYQQSWPTTLAKAVVLFALETVLFVAVNIAGFVTAFVLV
jgi:hypothetical protein